MNNVFTILSATVATAGSAVLIWASLPTQPEVLEVVPESALQVAQNPFSSTAPVPSWPEPASAAEARLLSVGKGAVRLQLASSQEIYAKVEYDYTQKKIEFNWHFRGADNKPLLVEQIESVRFIPTDVAVEGVGKLLISGFAPATGVALVERWCLEAPNPFPGPRINAQTGEVTEAHMSATITSKEVVMRVGGGDPIWKLFPVRGDAPRMYALFLNSRGVGLLDPALNLVSPLLAPVAVAGAQVIPELTQLNETRWSAEHQVAGYFYYLGRIHQSGNSAIAILDIDKDGQLDVAGVLSSSEMGTLEISDGDKYDTRF